MKLDEMVAKISGKAKVDEVATRRVVRELLASLREELSSAAAESRVTVAALGTFVIRPGKDEGGRNRILLNLSQKTAAAPKSGATRTAGK